MINFHYFIKITYFISQLSIYLQNILANFLQILNGLVQRELFLLKGIICKQRRRSVPCREFLYTEDQVEAAPPKNAAQCPSSYACSTMEEQISLTDYK